MIHFNKIYLCLAIFACSFVAISASQENQNQKIELLEQEIAQLNLQIIKLKISLSATNVLTCALTMSNDNMAKLIESHNVQAETSRIKKCNIQKLLDEDFNQGL